MQRWIITTTFIEHKIDFWLLKLNDTFRINPFFAHVTCAFRKTLYVVPQLIITTQTPYMNIFLITFYDW